MDFATTCAQREHAACGLAVPLCAAAGFAGAGSKAGQGPSWPVDVDDAAREREREMHFLVEGLEGPIRAEQRRFLRGDN